MTTEHMDDILINLSDPVNRAAYFGVLLNKVPTYQEIKDGTKISSHNRSK
jgi:hypothetical protein